MSASFVETVISVFSALGGFGFIVAIIFGVSTWASNHASKRWLQDKEGELTRALETHKAHLSKESENHKLSLKRQELLFQRELDAADAFMAVWRVINPKHNRPEMDSYDACVDVAQELETIEKVLDEYLVRHSVAISENARNMIERAVSEAATEKFFVSDIDREPPAEAIKAAEHILQAVNDARDELLKHLRR
jgi:hypothetical protein